MTSLKISIWILLFGVLFSPLAFETNVFPLNITGNRKTDDKSEQAEMWSQKGVAFYEKKEYKPAIECFLKAVDLNPDGIEYRINLVRAFRDDGKFEKAEKLLGDALEKFPQKVEQEKLQIELADVHYGWAEYLKKKKIITLPSSIIKCLMQLIKFIGQRNLLWP